VATAALVPLLVQLQANTTQTPIPPARLLSVLATLEPVTQVPVLQLEPPQVV